MKRKFYILLFALLVLPFVAFPVLAEENGETEDEDLVESLMAQIEALKAQIEAVRAKIQTLMRTRSKEQAGLKEEAKELKEEAKEIRYELRLTRQLWLGTRGENVELLQEFLATDPEIYPEGLVTGYFGPLTFGAVKRFQKEAGIEQVGRVGPKTVSKINELLEEGAGESGQVPPGLLVSPGIRKKLGYTPEVPEDQVLPPGIQKKLEGETETEIEVDEEPTSLEISEVTVLEVRPDSALLSWLTDREADSDVFYDTSSGVEISSADTFHSSDLVEEHEVELEELSSDTEYFFFVSSTDEFGNNATSTEESFTTSSSSE